MFSSGMLGIGVAVRPWEGKLYAPVNGTVASVFDTGHALGIVAENGAELLIHVGMDTVELQGKYFKPHVKAGDRVKTGDMLLTFDKEAIEKEGYETVTPVIVSNSTNHTAVCKGEPRMIKAGDLIMTVE